MRSLTKTITLNSTYTTIDLGKDMGDANYSVFVIAKYDGFYSFDAAPLTANTIRIRAFKNGVQTTAGTVEISLLIRKNNR